MKNNESGVAGLVVLIAVAAVVGLAAVLGPTPKGKGVVWYAPKTWFSHAPAAAVDKQQAKVDQAQQSVSDSEKAMIHQATVESHKTVIGANQLPASQNAAVVQRTASNTFGILNQLSPLTVEEQSNDQSIILGLLSTEVAKREAAEAKQKAAEDDAAAKGRENEKLKSDLAQKVKDLAGAQANLRARFDVENGLANDLRAQTARFWIAAVLVVLLLIAALYFRFVAGGVGKALHSIEPIIGSDNYNAVVSELDSNLGALAQWAVRTGRQDAARMEAKAKALLSGKPPATASAAGPTEPAKT